MIHPSALVADSARIGNNVTIEAFAVISDNVVIGDDCYIESHAVIKPFVTLGKNNRVCSQTVIGGLPQDLQFDPATSSEVIIGDNNTFREGFSVHRASVADGVTRIGNDCYFMNNTHVGHDCIVGNHVIAAPCVSLGGFSEAGDGVFFGGGSMVHQFARVGSLAMIGGLIPVTHDVLPFTLINNNPPRHCKLNSVGLKRIGLDDNKIGILQQAYDKLANNETLDGIEETPEIQFLKHWLSRESKRKLTRFSA